MDADTNHEAVARRIVERLQQAGHIAVWAGGCVRDRLLGRPSSDIDVATNARPEQVRALFPAGKEIGRAFGVVLVREGGHDFEVATFRRDEGYSDGRHPDRVEFADLRADAARRDFTINGMFYDPVAGRVIDLVGGEEDLRRSRIRAIGDPGARFAEDHLRMLRAVRFASVLEFELEAGTRDAIRRESPAIRRIAVERVREELDRLFTESPRPGRGLRLLLETGLLKEILPEVAALEGVPQPPDHHPEGDVFAHTALMLDCLEKPSVELAWAALLHDVGKPPTLTWAVGSDGPPRPRFHGHDRVGADMAREILTRLKHSNRVRDLVVAAVSGHMRFHEAPRMRVATLKRWVATPTFPLELELHRLDCLGSRRDLATHRFVTDFLAAQRGAPIRPPPLLRGEDVLAAGVPPGPRVAALLNAAYTRQLEQPEWTRGDALVWLRNEARD